MLIDRIALQEEIAKTLDKVLKDTDYDVPLAELDVDPAARHALHRHLDRFCSIACTGSTWDAFQTLNDVVAWYFATVDDATVRKKYRQIVNMPQMALTGLSESWLFKEIGDCHWHMLCDDLGLKSNEIVDEFRNRLYATFIRIRFESSRSLKHYQENDTIDITGRIQRFGNSLYFGQVNLRSDDKSIVSSLVTTFSARESGCGNHKLTKGVPAASDKDALPMVTEMPKLVLEHIRLKKGAIQTVELGGHTFAVTDEALFELSYQLNPYTDINGVGLLYFAAYPLINDYCELAYFNKDRFSGSHWAMASATTMRDIFYFANCNIEDVITYRLNSYELLAGNRMAIQSTLLRESDGTVMARIFTVKELESH